MIHALVFGLEIKNHGFNIYALGPTGTGKTTVVLKYLEKEAKTKPTPPDWLYVNNFESSDKPKKMQLPAGKGRELRDDIDQLVLALKTEVPKAFEAENYEHEHETIEKKFRTHTEELFQQLAKKTGEHGFQLMQSPQGFTVLPIVSGEWYACVDFIVSLGAVLCVGFLLAAFGATKCRATWMHGMVTAGVSWLVVMAVAALPYWLSGNYRSYLDGMFDVMSGFTTTGLTLIQDLDHISDSLNMWRHLLTFVGGQGVIDPNA